MNQARCNFLERKTDDLEQYGRRLYIRIDGVEVNEDETVEECTGKVLNMLHNSDVEVKLIEPRESDLKGLQVLMGRKFSK